MKTLILSLVLSSFVFLFAQTSAEFEQTFIFADEYNNSQSLILGYDPFGSSLLNPNLGEVIIPQVPPGQFGVRFQLPPDTSIYTVKDIRFGCGQPFYYEHLIDLSYASFPGAMTVDWEWESWELWVIRFIDPYNGQTLATFEEYYDSSFYEIPALYKIIIGVQYNGPLSWPEYEVISPNGGEELVGGEYYTITWSSNGIIYPSKLEYSTDAGSSWILISDSLYNANNSYDWLVPYVTTYTCLIRIGDYPCSYDISDAIFTITYPVSVENENELPTEFSLSQNYPNPFNPLTKIKYAIPTPPVSSPLAKGRTKEGFVTLKVYDVLGNEVATLVNEEKPSGEYEVKFDGSELPSGVYFYQLKAGSFIESKKMSLLK